MGLILPFLGYLAMSRAILAVTTEGICVPSAKHWTGSHNKELPGPKFQSWAHCTVQNICVSGFNICIKVHSTIFNKSHCERHLSIKNATGPEYILLKGPFPHNICCQSVNKLLACQT